MSDKEERRQRLGFQDFQLVRFPNGRSRARVLMDWTRGRSYTGESEGNQTLEGEVRAAADAALKAAAGASEGKLDLDLRGTKALRVFDAWVVVVMVRAWIDNEPLQLLGAYPCPDDDTPRGPSWPCWTLRIVFWRASSSRKFRVGPFPSPLSKEKGASRLRGRRLVSPP